MNLGQLVNKTGFVQAGVVGTVGTCLNKEKYHYLHKAIHQPHTRAGGNLGGSTTLKNTNKPSFLENTFDDKGLIKMELFAPDNFKEIPNSLVHVIFS